MMKCSINEIFGPTIQGEGLFAGVPSIFVRFNGCNLRCCFKGGSICDTAYTSHNPETPSITDTDEAYSKITKILKEYPNVTDIVFTGGEPMLQQEAMADIIQKLGLELCYTVETNGTVPLKECMKGLINLWSVSPKLSNSCCFNDSIPEKLQQLHRLNRINYPAVGSYINDSEVQLKFVYTDEETEREIIDWIHCLYVRVRMDIKLKDVPVLIMPEGETTDQLNQSSQKAITACIKNGWRFCDRTHIRIWGNKRAV